MKFEEVENCDFEPTILHRLPKKMKIDKPELYEKPPPLKEYLKTMETNLAGLKQKKKCIYRKALESFNIGQLIDAYKLLTKHFNINQLRKELGNPNDKGPKLGTPVGDILYPVGKVLEPEKPGDENKDNREPEVKKQPKTKPKPKPTSEANFSEGIDGFGDLDGFEDDANADIFEEDHKEKPKKPKETKADRGRSEGHYVDEDIADKVYLNFLREVFNLAKEIEDYQDEWVKLLKTTKAKLNKFKSEQKNQNDFEGGFISMNKDGDSKKSVKSIMCPLGEKCPDFSRDRWPMTNKKGIKPFGEQCPFAHHPFHLRFEAQEESEKKQLENLVKVIEKRIADGKISGDANLFWNPGNNLLKECFAKCNKCWKCKFDVDNKEKMKNFAEKAATRNQKLKKSEKVTEKLAKIKTKDENLAKKLGYLRKAETLYKKERYKDAFDNIIFAIKVVKKELKDDEQEEEDKKDELKKKLGLDYDFELDKNKILLAQENLNKVKLDSEEEGSEDENIDEKFQKLVYYGLKTNLIGQGKVDIKRFVKEQIEVL